MDLDDARYVNSSFFTSAEDEQPILDSLSAVLKELDHPLAVIGDAAHKFPKIGLTSSRPPNRTGNICPFRKRSLDQS
jgi:hypothetical protein